MQNRRQVLGSGAALAGLALAHGQARGQAPGGATPAIVSLSEQRSRFLVEVGVDGSGGYRFVLDTGASTHFISTRLVRALALPRVDERMVRGHAGRNRDTVVGITRLNVGGLEMGPSRAIAWGPERLGNHDGLIGYPFLYPRAVVALGASRISIGAADTAMTLVPVRAEVMRNQALLLGGIPQADGRFVFDTGAQACTISDTYYARVRDTAAYRGAVLLAYRDAEGATRVTAFRPAEMRFGDFVMTHPVVRIGQAADRDGLFHGVDGLLGVSLLRPYTWAIDQAAGTLMAGGTPPAPVAYEGSGLRLSRADGTITAIADGSPAFEAGLRPGQQVLGLSQAPGRQVLELPGQARVELEVRALL